MTHTFKLGDRVVIVRSDRTERIGTVATIVGTSKRLDGSEYTIRGPWNHLPAGTVMWHLDLPLAPDSVPTAKSVAYPSTHLEPYRPDHNERAEWTPELVKLCRKGRVGA